MQGQHVDAEATLQRREPEQLRQHHFGFGAALQFDDHAHALAVGFVAQVRDSFDPLVAHDLGDDLDHPRLVHLIGNLVDDDRLAVLAHLLERGLPAHDHRAAAGVIGLHDAGPAHDQPAGREIGALDGVFDQLFDSDVGVGDIGAAGVDDLAQVMGRDVGGHADGDAAGAVDQKGGEPGRQDRRFAHRFVVVGLEIDGILVDVLEQRGGGAGQAGLGVAHGRRPVAVHGAEVALGVDQHQAEREVLRHPYHGVEDGLVAVGMVLTHDVADDARRFAERLVVFVAAFLHRKENPAVHRLQSVADIGQRARHDHAHRVIEIR